MNNLKSFTELFLEIWQKGIAGVNFTQIGLEIAIFLFFLLLRGLIAKFILQRLKNYVSKTSNKFDDALVHASEGPVKFIPVNILHLLYVNNSQIITSFCSCEFQY